MSESKLYKEQGSEPQYVSEAAMMYGAETCSIEDFVASIPVHLMQRLAEFALEECEAGRCTPHEEMKKRIKQEMGW